MFNVEQDLNLALDRVKQVQGIIEEDGLCQKRDSNYLSNSSSIGNRYHEGVRDGISASLVRMKAIFKINQEGKK